METLTIVECADDLWPPYRILNRTSRVMRFRQRLGTVPLDLDRCETFADLDGEMAAAATREREDDCGSLQEPLGARTRRATSNDRYAICNFVGL